MSDIAVPAAPLTTPEPSMLLAGLVDGLSSSGALTPEWRAAFFAVPRHLFVPDLVWREGEQDGAPHPILRAEQPEMWLEMVYRDEPVVTQINDGAPGACHYNCVSHGWTKIGRCDRHSAGKGTICESGHQCR